MQTKLITLRGREFLIGLGRGTFGIGKGHFILAKEGDFIRAWHQSGFDRISDTFKVIAAMWVEAQLFTGEVKPLPEYYDLVTTLCLVNEKVISALPSISEGLQELAPDYREYMYNIYYDQISTGAKNGINLYGACLSVYFNTKFGEYCVDKNGNIFQPVTYDMAHNVRTVEEDPYLLTIKPVDGEGPFLFSTDNQVWSSNPVLTYDGQDNRKVYVKDSAGTIKSSSVDITPWLIA
jgi:hypothetical protein